MNSRKMERESLHVHSIILFIEITNTQNLVYSHETKTMYFVTLD